MHKSLLLLTLLTLGTSAWSQAPPASAIDSVDGRTVEDLVDLAFRQNGELLATQQQVSVARGGLTQARLRPNPTIDISGMQEYRGPMNAFTVEASIPLELFGRRDRRIEVAEHGVTISEFDRADGERRLRAEVASKFGDVLAAAQSVQLAAELLAVNRDAQRLVDARAERGAIPTLDADQLRVEVNRLDATRIDAESRLGVAMLELKSLVGMRPDEDLRLRGTLEVSSNVPTEPQIAEMVASRPDLRAAREAEEAAKSRIRHAQTDGRLDASLSGSYQRADSGFPINGFNSAGQLARVQGIFNLATIGVSITLPTRNRNEGLIAAATAELEAAKRRREYTELVATREVRAAMLQQAKAKESLDIYRGGVRDQARQNLTVIRRVYELGQSRLLDVIAEQRRVLEIEQGYIDALNRSYQASVLLQLAMGEK